MSSVRARAQRRSIMHVPMRRLVGVLTCVVLVSTGCGGSTAKSYPPESGAEYKRREELRGFVRQRVNEAHTRHRSVSVAQLMDEWFAKERPQEFAAARSRHKELGAFVERRTNEARERRRAVSVEQLTKEWLAKQRRPKQVSTITVGNAP